MKRFLWGFCVACLVILEVFAQSSDSERVAQQAAAMFAAGDYAAAVALYEQLLDAGVESVAVYVNLGSAYYLQGEPGLALVSLLRARQIAPRMAEISTLISQIRGERIDFQVGEASLVDAAAESVASVLTLNELLWLGFTVWVMWALVALLFVLRPGMRGRLRAGFATITLLVCLLLGAILIREYVAEQRPQAVVVQDVIQVMSGPGDEYLPLYRLFQAAEIRIVDSSGQWVRIVLPDGRQGWVESASVIMI